MHNGEEVGATLPEVGTGAGDEIMALARGANRDGHFGDANARDDEARITSQR